ncbi:unnamed protein product [Aspergillus oryzae]|uniref:Unnamed protein product n=2 Tax=Aspergillus oryzae TaxID=5062 RepID=A0AAN5C5B3_ASPOZ|nr:unnamed protein product [Aspergillus oryzae]GMF89110.1 unnamed protein product [Aspergillus oryzae]GMG02871.1 unnamed protein product [Aspergillus oryzae]GMG38300.1 unnamed protein product [Aspergillus oryzae]GMG48825.1 unnamed protein product [Aspergillus oryzae var. brunneus]
MISEDEVIDGVSLVGFFLRYRTFPHSFFPVYRFSFIYATSTTRKASPEYSGPENRYAPEFKIDKAQLAAVRDLCSQLNEKLPVDSSHPSDDLVQDIESREEELEDNIGGADLLEGQDLETSGISEP